MTTKALTAAAQAVRDAHTELERINGQAAGLRQALEEMDGQRATLAELRERRAQLLQEALLAGRKADTGEVDKLITAAQRAIERREDERIATERALPALETQRAPAEVVLAERWGQYEQACAEHVAARVRKAIPAARELSAQFSSAISDLREGVALMPETAERQTLYREVNALWRELIEIRLDGPNPYRGTVWLEWDAPAVAGTVAEQARVDMESARKATGLPEGFVPALPVMPEKPVEILWSDGSIHSEPEPPPSQPPVRVVHANIPDGHTFRPGLVRSY